jgi:hypothetical protein
MTSLQSVTVQYSRPSADTEASAPETRTFEFPLSPTDASDGQQPEKAHLNALTSALEKTQVEMNAFLTEEMARDKEKEAKMPAKALTAKTYTEGEEGTGEIDEEQLFDEDVPDDDIE